MFAIFLPETAQRRRHSLDYLGGILLMIGVVALMLALVQARTSARAGLCPGGARDRQPRLAVRA